MKVRLAGRDSTTLPEPYVGTTLLLISGAGLPAWIWDDATTGLDATVARRPEGSNASLLQYAQAALDSASPGAISIVAHSAGGLVAAAMTALAPARVRGIVAVTAVRSSCRNSLRS